MPRPPVLTRTSRVAVIAPASAPPDPARYTEGLEALRQRGLLVDAPESINPYGYLAGPDEVRLQQWIHVLGRDDLDAVFCARGGYGVLRLLPHLDFDSYAQRPPLLIGYSDITALQLALLARTGVPSLSGPMVAPDWSRMDDYSEQLFWRLAGGETDVEIANPAGETMWSIKPGEVEGMLVGGNLTMITTLLGTPFMPDMEGAILFIEEVGEPPYRVDRLLAQLRLAGILERIGGLVIGAITDAEPSAGRPSLHMRDVIDHYASLVDGPVAGGLVYGHLRPKASIPIGIRARLEVSKHAGVLTTLEPLTG